MLVADTASGKIIAHTFEKSAIHSSQAFAMQFPIDTARYQLAPGKHAFGVKVTREHSSSAIPYEETVLSLYMIDGQRIRKMLNRLVVNQLTGWDMNCNGHFTNTARTLDIGPRDKGGYATLKITGKAVNTVNMKIGGQCIEKEMHSNHSITLEYRNGRYAIPKKMQVIGN